MEAACEIQNDNGGKYYDTRLRKNEELLSLITLHNCNKGSLCPVKHCNISWSLTSNGEHLIKFESQAFTYYCSKQSMQFITKVNIINHGYIGNITCTCTSANCLNNAIETICNIMPFAQ
ncbi:E3 13.4 kDa protein [California sea lion adenovirus 1]|uniref:E3 13.4 kDa protein n=1 Tax=California sea lion adenovirus 1 TaxID=943083 RepID=A0A059XIF8_9ADEN|nr:E3 13.4 kDa protein [California sea lion adenovirus 1]AIA22366.1 E3 13.4 kDa protein [California sea lion adenovirus 1]